MGIKKWFSQFNLSMVWHRFPLAVLSSVIVTLCLLILSEKLVDINSTSYIVLMKLLYTSTITFVYGVGVGLLHEKQKLKPYLRMAGLVVLILLMVVCLPNIQTEQTFIKHLCFFTVFNMSVLLLVFPGRKEAYDFWKYIIHLFLLFVETTLFAIFLFATLSIAIFAIGKLFNISFEDDVFLNMFIIIAAFFHPIYLLSRIQKANNDLLDFRNNQILKIFSGKILLTIVLVYATILIAYLVKIGLEFEWPRGWVSNMILWFSIFGNLAYVLNRHLYDEESRGKFISFFIKRFYYFQFFICGVLFSAIYIRVNAYGITESRYLVLASACWLLVNALYFIVSNRKDIRFIFLSLVIFLSFSLFSPWSLFHVSIDSQINQLKKEIMTLDEGSSSDVLKQNIIDKFKFLQTRNALEQVKEIDARFQAIDYSIEKRDSVSKASTFFFRDQYYNKFGKSKAIEELCQELGFNKHSINQAVNKHFNFYTNNPKSIDISAYDSLLALTEDHRQKDNQIVRLSDDNKALIFLDGSRDSFMVEQVFDVDATRGSEVDSFMLFKHENEFANYDFYFSEYSGAYRDSSYQIFHYKGFLCITSKK